MSLQSFELLVLILFLLSTFIIDSLLFLVTLPLDPTSYGVILTFHSSFSRSVYNSFYLLLYVKSLCLVF